MATKTYAKIRLQVAFLLAHDLREPGAFGRRVDGRGKQVLTEAVARQNIEAICNDPGVVAWFPTTCRFLPKVI